MKGAGIISAKQKSLYLLKERGREIDHNKCSLPLLYLWISILPCLLCTQEQGRQAGCSVPVLGCCGLTEVAVIMQGLLFHVG